MDPDFILMDDNACPQRAWVTNAYLQTATIDGMDWPARSSDLNPIGHAWDMLQTTISDHSVQPTKVPELQQALLDQCGLNPTAKHSKANKKAKPSSNQVKWPLQLILKPIQAPFLIFPKILI